MQKATKFVTKLAFIALFTATLSCERDALLPEEASETRSVPLTPKDKIRNGFSLENFNDPAGIIKNNIGVQWENKSTKTIAETLWYEFDVIQQQKARMVSQFQEAPQHKLLARLDENDVPHYFLAKLSPEPFITSPEFSYLNPEGFSGTVSLYNLQGEVVFLEYYKKGQVQNTVADISIKNGLGPVSNQCVQKGITMAQCDTALECAFTLVNGGSTGGGCGGGGSGGSYVAVRTDHYTDWYNIRSDGTADYSHTQFNGSTYDYIYVNDTNNYSYNFQNSYNYYNDTGHGEYGHYTDTPPDNDMPDRIILDVSFETNPKIHCTYQQLLKNTTIKALLDDFFGDDADYDLSFEVVPNLTCNSKPNPEGCTSSNLESDGTVTISIDQDYVNSDQTPTLFLAHAIIHEAIHANLYLALYNHSNGNTVNLPDINDFPAIYEQYGNIKGWQHEFMANHYVSLMAQILQEIHPLLNDQNFINTLNTDYPDLSLEEFYTSIAYLGLNGTTGQTNYLSNQENSNNYNISFYTAQASATKTPHCD